MGTDALMPTGACCANPNCTNWASTYSLTCPDCDQLRESHDGDVCDTCGDWFEGLGYDPEIGIECQDCRPKED
jgi:hypothetical protein